MGGNSKVDYLLNIWRREPTINENVSTWHTDPPRLGEFGDFPDDLHPLLQTALRNLGIKRLYSHQLESWETVSEGKNLVIVTGTASGKTLCYNLPVLDLLLKSETATALYFFPTKALSQDQKESLDRLVSGIGAGQEFVQSIPVAVYDGDTPASHRNAIRKNARILITNPDMIHVGVLPHHTLWANFFKNLRFIIIDEIHVYRGVFGSHVANLIRRIKRVCRFYGSPEPQFIMTSATIGNPVDHASRLIEGPVAAVEHDGAPRGARHFLLYNPPVINQELGLRRSASAESIRLADDLLAYQVQSLLFARTRRSVEIILKDLQLHQSGQIDRLHGYRSGYLASERREIEQGLRNGEIRAVVATNALELGIDIGSAGAVLMVGYPGTIAAARQQAGRAGRRSESSLAVLVASAGPLDQFLMRHPEYIFDHSPEKALINPDNLLILLHHLRCAAFELNFTAGEPFGALDQKLLEELLLMLEQTGLLHRNGVRYYWAADQYPAMQVSLRSASGNTYLLHSVEEDKWRTIGEVDAESAKWMVHPDAIYLHEGQTYRVDDLDLVKKQARLSAVSVDYFTEPRNDVKIEKINTLGEETVSGGYKAYGELMVTSQVIGFRKVSWTTREILSEHDLDLPPTQLRTVGYWLSISEEGVSQLDTLGLWRNEANNYGPNWGRIRELIRRRDGYKCKVCGMPEREKEHHVHHIVPFKSFQSVMEANRLDNLVTLCPACHQKVELNVKVRSGLGGLRYVLHQISPLFVMCDASDLGSHADSESKLTDGRPTVILYDLLPAGIGLSESLYEGHDDLIPRCLELVESCVCKDGCPGCVGPGGENGLGGKEMTKALLALLCGKL